MHIKVYFVGSFQGVSCSESTTADEVIEYILEHNDINKKYASLCALLEIRADNFGYPLAHNEVMTRFEGKNCLHFRILNIPCTVKTETLDSNFLELMHNQVHRLTVSRAWLVTDEQSLFLAAYRCGIEFGDYNQANHKPGFLSKTITQIIPSDVLCTIKVKDAEQIILENWQKLSQQGKTKDHQQTVLNYLQACQENVKQYGSASFICRLLKVNGEEKDLYIYISVHSKGYLLLNPDGEEIAQFSHDDAKITYPMSASETNLTIQALKNTFQCEMNGIMAMKQVAEFMKNSMCPE